MEDLFDEVPDAEEFCRAIIAEPQAYLLYPEERFAQLTAGVLACTSVDSHGEAFSERALAELVRKVEKAAFWMLAQHDPRIQPVGRVLAARLFRAETSGTTFVAGVSGTYDASLLKSFEAVEWSEVPGAREFDEPTDAAPGDFTVGANPIEIPSDLIQEALESAPPMVSRTVQRQFRKAFDPLSMISIAVPLFLIAQTPFLKKFQERLGEAAATEVLAALSWIKTTLAPLIAERFARTVLYELTFSHKECRVQFLIDSKDPATVAMAVDALADGVTRAAQLIENGAFLEPQKLVYLFDHTGTKQWLPLHAATRKHGVVSNRPYLISLDGFTGFSLGGATVTHLTPPQAPPPLLDSEGPPMLEPHEVPMAALPESAGSTDDPPQGTP